MIRIYVRGRHAQLLETELLTGGSLGPVVSFQLDTAWDGLAKVAVFRRGGQKWDVALEEEPLCGIPREALAKAGGELLVGIYGTDGETVAIPTVWVTAGPVRPGALPGGIDPGEQSGTLLEQLMAQFETYVTQKNVWGGRVDALIEYLGSRVSSLELADNGFESRVTSLESSMSGKMNKANPNGTGSMTMGANTMDDGLVLLDAVASGVKAKASLGKITLATMSAGDEMPARAVTISGLAEPDNDNEAANKGYVDETIAGALEGKRFVPAGGSGGQILVLRGNSPEWGDETRQTFGVCGTEVTTTEQSFQITGLNHSLQEIKSKVPSYNCLPFFILQRADGKRILPLVHLEDTEADFYGPGIPGVSTEAILVRVTADGAVGTKY